MFAPGTLNRIEPKHPTVPTVMAAPSHVFMYCQHNSARVKVHMHVRIRRLGAVQRKSASGRSAEEGCAGGVCMYRQHGKKMIVHLFCRQSVQRRVGSGNSRTRIVGVQNLCETHALLCAHLNTRIHATKQGRSSKCLLTQAINGSETSKHVAT